VTGKSGSFRRWRMAAGLLCALGVLALAPAPGRAQTADAFYKNKTMTYIVATAPGGGYDDYGRLIARAMAKVMPGTRVIVQNIPGAGHIIGADTIYVARPDGLTIGTFNTGLILAQLIKEQGVKFDLAKMSWIGKAASDPRVLVLTKESGYRSVQDLMDFSKPAAKLSVAGVGSASYIDVKLVAEALHLNVMLVPGFNGNEGEMSMLRKETAGTLGSESSLKSFVNEGNGFFALEIGGAPDSKIPQGPSLVKDDRGRELMSLIAAESVIGRLTAGPPGVAADRLALLRDDYLKALADPDLLATAQKSGIPIDPAGGQETEKIIKDALSLSPETVALVTKIVNDNK
jgi:tripartite-type tricarboxylate transporter receptor subunit TctC